MNDEDEVQLVIIVYMRFEDVADCYLSQHVTEMSNFA